MNKYFGISFNSMNIETKLLIRKDKNALDNNIIISNIISEKINTPVNLKN